MYVRDTEGSQLKLKGGTTGRFPPNACGAVSLNACVNTSLPDWNERWEWERPDEAHVFPSGGMPNANF